MRTSNKILLGLLILAIGYFFYVFTNYKEKLFGVYDVPAKYTITYGDNPTVSIVDFNRPECPACVDMHPVITQAMKQDGGVRYIPRILRSENEEHNQMYKMVYAAAEQDKFAEMFTLIYKKWPINSVNDLYNYASEIGIDTIRLSRDVHNSEIDAYMDETMNYFEAWFFVSTPTIVIDRSKIFRPIKTEPSVSLFLDEFEIARKKAGVSK